MHTDKQMHAEILAALETRLTSILNHDPETLSTVMHDKYMMHSPFAVYDKATYIKVFAAAQDTHPQLFKDPNILSLDYNDFVATAVIEFEGAAEFEGKLHNGRYHLYDTLINENGSWKLLASHYERVA